MAEDDILTLPAERKSQLPLLVFFKDARHVFKKDDLGLEILRIALPAALALAADPIASLIDTAFVGHLGPVEIAAVGVSIAIFNQASKVAILPIVSITTSFVAEEDTLKKLNSESQEVAHHDDDLEKGSRKNNVEMKDVMMAPAEHAIKQLGDHLENNSAAESKTKESKPEDDSNNGEVPKSPTIISVNTNRKKSKSERRNIPSASTALFLGGVLGILQSMFLILLAKPLLGFMGVKPGSPMLSPARKYLTLRALGAPAVLLSLTMQGVFRGFKDTKTPLYATVAGDAANIVLDPIFIFALRQGVSGAAIAHVLSQYLICMILFSKLAKKVDLLPPSVQDMELSKFLKSGSLLLARVIAVTFCLTLAASMAAKLGSTPMAAFQVCLQVWMTSSLLADGLAVAGQAIIACAFAEKDRKKATAAAVRVLQMGFALGLGLAVVVGLGLQLGSGVFSEDQRVIHFISIGLPFVAATQPINSLAFVFDGVNFGAYDFAYSAYSMILVAIVSIGSLFVLSKTSGFVGIWLALTVYMALRTFAGVWRMGTGTGPWHFLRTNYCHRI